MNNAQSYRVPTAVVALALVGCGGGSGSGSFTSAVTVKNAELIKSTNKIEHIVIIIQENRTPDNLFYGLPGADVLSSGMTATPLAAPNDMSHAHAAFVADFDDGKLDGFTPKTKSYVLHSDEQPYFDLAKQYAFGDRMFQSNEGPSYPAHQYLVSGTSTSAEGSNLRVAENPAGNGFTGPMTKGGCDSTPNVLVKLIDEQGNEDRSVFPCFERPALTDLVNAKGLTWRYYEAHLGAGLWNGLDSIRHIQQSAEFATDVIAPSAQVLSDIADGMLAAVTYVTPTAKASDHPSITDGTGPDWVASVVNAIGKSKYWNSTAIIVTWDDWAAGTTTSRRRSTTATSLASASRSSLSRPTPSMATSRTHSMSSGAS